MTGLDLSTKAGVLRFSEQRRDEMVRCWQKLGRFESNGYAFCGYVFATHEARVPTVPTDLGDWKTGPKLDAVTAIPVLMPGALHAVIPAHRETEIFSLATRTFAKITRSIGSLVMMEMWFTESLSIEERNALPERLEDFEGRGEALYMQLEHAATGRRVWTAKILRDPSRLDPWKDFAADHFEGRLVDLAEWKS